MTTATIHSLPRLHDDYALAWFAAEARRTAAPVCEVVDLQAYKARKEQSNV